jgi:hypothetical protein
MPEADSKQDKAAETATVKGAAAERREERARRRDSQERPEDEVRAEKVAEARVGARSAAELSTSEDLDAGEKTYDPFPAYDQLSLDELRSLAEDREVEINRDVEKAERVRVLREADRKSFTEPDDSSVRPQDAAREAAEAEVTTPNYNLMGLDELRSLCDERSARLPAEFERAHLVGELRAADTSTR